MEENVIRREALFDLMDDNSAAVIFAGTAKVASEDEDLPFLANRHFFYLTNIEQEHSILLLIKGVGIKKTYLFVDEYDPVKEKWYGRSLTMQEASELSNITSVYSVKDFDAMLAMALAKDNNQYGDIKSLYLDLTPEIKVKSQTSTLEFKKEIEEKFPHIQVGNIYEFVTMLRTKKSAYEVDCLKKAISLTNAGLLDLINNLKPGVFEYQLSDRFEFFGRSHDRSELSFSTICASGKNAIVLHYPVAIQNCQIGNDDLVLFDLGFGHKGYSADITRTYPASGKFNALQTKVYQAVLNCNKAVIEYIHPGLTIQDLQNFTLEFIKNECVKAGLLKEEEDIRTVYYHNISHFLGLDTHDCGDRKRPLEVGNVITVEPGLYFKSLGIGVRIEDDVLVTENGCEVLSKDIAKEIGDIEKLFKTRGF